MPKALIFCAKYSQDQNDGWLTDELIQELESQGYEVTVFAVGDITFSKHSNRKISRKEYLFPTDRISKYKKYFVLWPKLIKVLKEDLKATIKYDLMIAFAPLSVMLPVIKIACDSKIIEKKICILFDFFPIHQVQINLINKRFESVFKWIESYLLRKFDMVTGMTPRNVQMIKAYYNLDSCKTVLKTLYLWGLKPNNYKSLVKDEDSTIKMVFGGQIIPGRAINKLIELTLQLRLLGLPVNLSIYSTGKGFEELKSIYRDISDVIFFKERLPRDIYIKEVLKYDVGAIVTDVRVSMPTFPSKIIDYMNCSLPCLCMIEKSSDIENVINNKELLHVNNFDFSNEALADASEFLSQIKSTVYKSSLELDKKFTVREAVMTLVN